MKTKTEIRAMVESQKICSAECLCINGEEMFEVTALEHSFGKSFNDWVRMPSTKEYLKILAFARTRESLGNSLYTKDKFYKEYCRYLERTMVAGGRNMDKLYVVKPLYLEFARWLSPAFSVQCNLYGEPLISSF